jgi:hypothetical protein
LDLPDELDERPEIDFDRPPPLERDDELLPVVERPPLRDPDERLLPEAAIFSAAAPIAPTAAPAAAPLMISPATSISLSTIPDVDEVFRDLDDRRFDEDVEDELLLREPPELVLLAIFPSQMIVVKT